MNIIFVAPNYYPHIGGVEKHIRELSYELIKDGHSIIIFVVKSEKLYKDYENDGVIKIIRFNRTSIKFINRFYLNLQLVKHVAKFKQADIIHFHDFGTMWILGLLVYPLLRYMHKKIFITFHGWEGDIPPKKSSIRKRKICEKLADANICVGHFIQKWYGTKADIVTYGGVHKADAIPAAGLLSVVTVF